MESPDDRVGPAEVETRMAELRDGDPQPPAEMTSTVMDAVTRAQADFSDWQRASRLRRAEDVANFSAAARVDSSNYQQGQHQAAWGGTLVAKKILMGLTGIAAVAVLSFFVFGYPPVVPGTEGTVGAARRYQGSQMSSKDVAVGADAIQDFMQSETFDYIMRNPDTRTALQAMVSSSALAQVLADSDARTMLSSPEVQHLFAAPELATALADTDFRAQFLSADVQAALADADLRTRLASADVQAALSSAELQARFQPSVMAFLADARVSAMMKQPGVAQALAAPGIRALLSQDAMAQALAAPGVMQLFARSEFAAALSSAQFTAMFAQPGLAQALANPSLVQGLAARLQ